VGGGWNTRVRGREEAWRRLKFSVEKNFGRWRQEWGGQREPQKIWGNWLEIHNKIARETIGRSKRKKKRPWRGKGNQKIEEAVREKNKCRKLMGETSGVIREEVVAQKRKIEKVIKKLVREERDKERDKINGKLERLRGKDEKQYWKFLREVAEIPKKTEIKVLPKEMKLEGEIVKGKNVGQAWNHSFSKLGRFNLEDKNYDKDFCEEVREVIRNFGENKREGERELDREIELGEVEEAIRRLKRGKAAGEDGCVNEILKFGGEEMKISIWTLLKNLWEIEEIPEDWARGVIVPIHKEGDPKDPDNYRGITLLSVVGKVYTTVLNSRLSQWLEKREKLVEEQGGFRKERATAEQVYILKEIIEGRKREKKKTYCCFLDIRKAYDTVFRDGLWLELLKKGVQGKMWRVIKNMYKVVESCVRIGPNAKTDWFGLEVGLRQGCILSPTLFLIFINGLAERLKEVGGARYRDIKVSLLLFADDIVLMAESKRELQVMLNVVDEYSKLFRFRFNKDKCSVMIFEKKQNRRQTEEKEKPIEKFYLGGEELKIASHYKYLGLLVDKDFTWQQHVENLIAKAQKKMKAIFGLGVGKGLSARALMRGWEVLVRPLLEFSCEIWGEKVWKQFETLQHEMGRRVLGVSRMTANQVIRGELGLQRMRARRVLSRIRFWSKIVKMNENRLVKKVYMARREEFIEGRKRDRNNWCYATWRALKDLGLEHMWESQNFGSCKDWEVVVKNTIQAKEEMIWRVEMSKKPKLRLYRIIKNNLCRESFLLEMKREEYRQLVMLRSGTNYLEIERGRWRREKIEERTCMVCMKDSVEDEEHFLLGCSMYAKQRAKMFEEIKSKCFIDLEKEEKKVIVDMLIGSGRGELDKEIREIVVAFIKSAVMKRKQYIKDH